MFHSFSVGGGPMPAWRAGSWSWATAMYAASSGVMLTTGCCAPAGCPGAPAVVSAALVWAGVNRGLVGAGQKAELSPARVTGTLVSRQVRCLASAALYPATASVTGERGSAR